MTIVPTDPAARLRRGDTAAALTAAGFKISGCTLATMATRGGGPPFEVFGRTPLYKWSDALGWAKGRTTGPFRNTSEAAALAGSGGRPERGPCNLQPSNPTPTLK